MMHAMPLLTKLCIDKSSQMNLAVASRFRDITEIRINSLLEAIHYEDEFLDGVIDIGVHLETKIRTVPFLSRFDKLKMVHFGVKKENGEIVEGFSPVNGFNFFEDGEIDYPNEPVRDRMKAFLDHISGAFSIGALPKHLVMSGLCCPDAHGYHGRNRRSNNCETCLRACRSFPLKSVVEFECRGSSSTAFGHRIRRTHGLDVCIERAQIESIIESRPGGERIALL